MDCKFHPVMEIAGCVSTGSATARDDGKKVFFHFSHYQ